MPAYWIITFLGAGLTLMGVRSLNRYRAVRHWDRTRGTLTELRSGFAEERVKYSNLKYEYPIAAYEYQVGERKFTGTRVSVELKNLWVPVDEVGKAPWSDWKAGDQVAVFYDPNRPEDALLIPQLQRRRRSHLWAITLAGLLLMLGSIGIAALGV
jgi:hypothetical protein